MDNELRKLAQAQMTGLARVNSQLSSVANVTTELNRFANLATVSSQVNSLANVRAELNRLANLRIEVDRWKHLQLDGLATVSSQIGSLANVRAELSRVANLKTEIDRWKNLEVMTGHIGHLSEEYRAAVRKLVGAQGRRHVHNDNQTPPKKQRGRVALEGTVKLKPVKPKAIHRWCRLAGFLLPTKTRIEDYEPSLHDLHQEYANARLAYSGRWERRWLLFCFVLNIAKLFPQSYWAWALARWILVVASLRSLCGL